MQMNLDTAIFYTKNISDIALFYQEIVGFKLESQNGDYYVSFLFPNGARLGIKKADQARELPGAQTIIVSVESNIEDLYKQIQSKNIPIYEELTTQEWGKNFAILDPDKNKVEFYEKPQEVL